MAVAVDEDGQRLAFQDPVPLDARLGVGNEFAVPVEVAGRRRGDLDDEEGDDGGGVGLVGEVVRGDHQVGFEVARRRVETPVGIDGQARGADSSRRRARYLATRTCPRLGGSMYRTPPTIPG